MPLLISFNTGMRRGEVCGLEWDTVNFAEGAIMVKQQMIHHPHRKWELATPKTKNSYYSIEIGAELLQILRDQRKRQSENRLKYGKYYTESNFVCTHENGANYKQIQVRLGHSRIATTMDTYAHATREKQRETANFFDSIFSKAKG
ncbi:site-specific integrase [Levilactobacillus wangkuiensis]|uniref:site-specific integrase n=2 Tax=Levilactobacillus wangkuiensis TaxID=2799566 RepID=UPI00195101F9|nr:site-specific integrase [Levilactobacillus wangkuiensis]